MQRERKRGKEFNLLITNAMNDKITTVDENTEEPNVVISFNQEHKAIEISSDECHFLLSPMPTMVGSFGTALWVVEHNPGWKLPTADEFSIVSEYLEEINKELLSNNYPQIDVSQKWWIDEYHIAESLIDASWAIYGRLLYDISNRQRIDEPSGFRIIKNLPPCAKEKKD